MKSKIEFFNKAKITKQLEDRLRAGDIVMIEERFRYLFSENDHLLILKGGEECKDFAHLEKLVDQILSLKPTRQTTIIILGGGALSDLGGLAAATVLRGLNWIVIPTTLLAQVDACLGGKVAINTRHGKNLIGAFHFPLEIWMADEFLTTLSENELQSGRGEILKYAFLDDKIADLIKNDAPIKDIVKACIKFKQDVVEQDPKEEHRRKILNLGHTYGHAFEVIHKLSHGEAVIQGLYVIIKKWSPKLMKEFALLCQKLKLRTLKELPITEEVLEIISHDKKKTSAGFIEIIVPEKIGEVVIKKIKLADL